MLLYTLVLPNNLKKIVANVMFHKLYADIITLNKKQ